MTTLNEGFVSNRLLALETKLLGIETLNLFLPLSLNDLDHIRLNLRS
jgi:hypothetical protein